MAEQYKIIRPIKYYRDYLNNNIRPDGREFDKFRPIAINIGSITTADGSAIVKLGNTTAVCGIRAELAKPKSNEPENGFLIPTVELIPICSQKFKGPGVGGASANGFRSVEEAEVYSCALNDILLNSDCINLKDLCITKEKLVWALYCDISCIDHDGSVIDAALIATVAALRDLTLPKISYDVEIDKISVDNTNRTKINMKPSPISTTLIVFDDIIITDPTKEEEDLSSSILTIAVCNAKVCFILKPGGTPFNQEQMDICIKQAIAREKSVLELLNNASKTQT